MLKFYKMTSCLRGINSCICTDKRQLSLRQTSYQIHNLLNMLQTSTFLPSAKHFPYSRQSEVTRNCGSCWQPICFSQILDFTPISVSNFFFSYETNFCWRQKAWLGKKLLFQLWKGNAITFLTDLACSTLWTNPRSRCWSSSLQMHKQFFKSWKWEKMWMNIEGSLGSFIGEKTEKHLCWLREWPRLKTTD